MRVRPLAALVVVVALAGCTSVVAGRGQRSGAPGSPHSSTSSSSSPAPVASLSVPNRADWPPPDLLRFAPSTGIGDPVTADLCAAIGLGPLRNLGGGLTPSFDGRQYPPGCSATLKAGSTPVLGVSVFGSDGTPSIASGRTTRNVAGETIYQFPFDSATGECRRELNPLGMLLTINAAPHGAAAPDQTLDCGATDAMAARLAKVVSVGTVPQLLIPSRSLTALDSCKVVQHAAITTLPAFTGGAITEQGFGASCEVRRSSVFLFFNFAVSVAARPNGARSVELDGHRLYETSALPNLCSYVSTQGSIRDGRYEQVAASATTSAGATPPKDLCTQTAQALARYLTAAQLP